MANPFGRNIPDAALSAAPFALPAAASSSTQSAAIDLGPGQKPENVQLELAIPALSATIAPNATTVTLTIESSTTSNFAAISRTLASVILTGASGAGVPASSLAAPLPPDSERFVRGKVSFGSGATTGAALSATCGLRT